MIRKNILSILIVIVVAISCNKIDNYDPPNGGIYGALVDQITNENLQTEQPGGFVIRMFEEGGQPHSPITFFGKPDGTYENSWVFQNEYKVLPTEGAFFPVDTAVVQVGERTERIFEVMPFLAVTDVSVTASTGSVTANYRIARSQEESKIMERKTLVSRVPTVNNIVFDFKAETSLSGIDDADVLAGSYTDDVAGLTSGTTYYVRVAVRTANALSKYNYSKVFEVTVP